MQSVKLVSTVTNELRKLFLREDQSISFPTRLQHSYAPSDSTPSLPQTTDRKSTFVNRDLTDRFHNETIRYFKYEVLGNETIFSIYNHHQHPLQS